MSFSLEFTEKSAKQWKKLDESIKNQFRKKIKERLENPKVAKDKLSGYKDIYKIKLKDLGYRLAYQVKESELIVLVLVVNQRANDKIYNELKRIFKTKSN